MSQLIISKSFIFSSRYIISNQLTTSAAVTQLRRLVVGFQPRQPRFYPRFGHMGFVVDEVALSEYFRFPCQFSFHRMLHTHLSSGAGTIGQLVTDEPSVLSLTPPYELKKKLHRRKII
jgi:hypothetical protein